VKYLCLIFALVSPIWANAGGHTEMGQILCRAEVGPDLMARQDCLREWQKDSYLVRRYIAHSGQGGQ